SVTTGVLHALIGPNGAGKSTLVNVITGLLPPTAGEVAVNRTSISGSAPDFIARRHILRTFQASNVFETLPIGDNLFLARRGARWPSPSRHAAALPLPPQAVRVLELSGLKTRLGERAAALGHGERKWLELSMVLAAEPAVIFLDEPTAGLSPANRLWAGEVLLTLVREHGIGLLLIEHDLDFVKSVAERVTVLSNGQVLADGSAKEVVSNAGVQAGLSWAPVETKGGWPMTLEVRDLRAGYGDLLVVRGVSLSVAPSEIVALLGRRRQND